MNKCRSCGGNLEDGYVNQAEEFSGGFAILENVPAQVCKQCGDGLFRPEVVEKIQQLVWSAATPSRTVRVPVYDLAEEQQVEASKVSLSWSSEYPFSTESIKDNASDTPGVYEILQRDLYARYCGSTRILKIGMSKTDLRGELENHVYRHTAANRLARIRGQAGLGVSFRYCEVEADEAGGVEKALLREFEDRHWDLPVLNAERGYSEGKDRHYRTS